MSNLAYPFQRAAVRISDYFHLTGRTQALELYRTGREIVFSLSVIALAFLLFLALRFLRGAVVHRTIFLPVAHGIALFAVPVAELFAFKQKWFPVPYGTSSSSFWTSLPWNVFEGEIIGACILLLAGCKRTYSLWLTGSLVTLHYLFWSWLAWESSRSLDLIAATVLYMAFPLSTFFSILVSKRSRRDMHHQAHFTVSGTAVLAGLSGLPIAVLAILWLPPRGFSFARPLQPGSVSIAMTRTSCFGSCPYYTITIHGNGAVEYEGKQHVAVNGPQSSVISQPHVAELLEDIDRAAFFAMEDRAFR